MLNSPILSHPKRLSFLGLKCLEIRALSPDILQHLVVARSKNKKPIGQDKGVYKGIENTHTKKWDRFWNLKTWLQDYSVTFLLGISTAALNDCTRKLFESLWFHPTASRAQDREQSVAKILVSFKTWYIWKLITKRNSTKICAIVLMISQRRSLCFHFGGLPIFWIQICGRETTIL